MAPLRPLSEAWKVRRRLLSTRVPFVYRRTDASVTLGRMLFSIPTSSRLCMIHVSLAGCAAFLTYAHAGVCMIVNACHSGQKRQRAATSDIDAETEARGRSEHGSAAPPVRHPDLFLGVRVGREVAELGTEGSLQLYL
jgi:hypothetical protein